MGHSLIFNKPYSSVLGLRLSGEQSRGMCSKYDPRTLGARLGSLGRLGLL